MNLHRALRRRQAEGRPLRVGVIGCGKFAGMFLAQVPTTPGLQVVAIADLDPGRARANLAAVGWPAERSAAGSARCRRSGDLAHRRCHGVGGCAEVELVVEATGDAVAGAAHALAAIEAGKHVVMVNVEADVLCGPALARRAEAQGVVYSLAYGDQPALIAEQVDWARACGLEVIAAGKGTKYLPAFHRSTPDTVWGHYGITPERAAAGGMNPKMFNSFLDGTKSAIEMAAVANACELGVPEDGLKFPPCGVDDLPFVLRPAEAGGQLERPGMVEVVSSLERDGRPVHRDLRWGVYVVFGALLGVRGALLCRVRAGDQPVRPLRRPLPPLPPDRAGARHQRRLGLPARRADRGADGLARRRRGRRQARSRRRRGAGRRRRALRLWPPGAGAARVQ